LRRDILAFATRTPSFRVGCGLGRAGFFCFPAAGIIGKAGVAAVAARSIDCVLMGPAIELSLGMPG
jgi:hypothetical protein